MSFYSIAPFIKEFYPQYYSIETYPVPQCAIIHKINMQWGIFSNFAHTPIVVNGVTFKTSEQLFQLMKFKDEQPLKEIYFQKRNPKMTAKKWEKTHRRPDWGSMLVDAIKFCIQQKYEQSKDFRNKLEESRGLFIVEDQSSFNKPNPDTWGVKKQGDNYIGPNLLGRLLMELRDNGKLEYQLPADTFHFIQLLNKSEQYIC